MGSSPVVFCELRDTAKRVENPNRRVGNQVGPSYLSVPRPLLLAAMVVGTPDDARRHAQAQRRSGRAAKTFRKYVRVDGAEVTIHVVVVREKAAKGGAK